MGRRCACGNHGAKRPLAILVNVEQELAHPWIWTSGTQDLPPFMVAAANVTLSHRLREITPLPEVRFRSLDGVDPAAPGEERTVLDLRPGGINRVRAPQVPQRLTRTVHTNGRTVVQSSADGETWSDEYILVDEPSNIPYRLWDEVR